MRFAKHVFTAITLGLIIIFGYLLYYTGYFKTVTLSAEIKGPYSVIYKVHTGPYHETVKTIIDVEKWSKGNGLKCRLSFGRYLDNPKVTEEGRLKSHGGCVIEDTEKAILDRIQLPTDLIKDDLKQTQYLTALFEGSPGIGPFKVYPKADEYIAIHKIKVAEPVIEIYEVFNDKKMTTTYLWEIIK